MAVPRLMTEQDIPAALSVWKEVHLSEGTQTLYTFLKVDPEGLFVVESEDGEIVGTCGAIISNPDLVCVGLYAVHPSYQGKGVGRKIWKKAMEHAGNRNTFLNAVPEYLTMYRDKAGFKFVSEHSSVICENTDVSLERLVEEIKGTEIRPISENLIDDVTEYDSKVAGYDRNTMVKHMVNEKDSVCLVALKEGIVCGYGCLKDNILDTVLFGPLYADTLEIAELLMRRLIETYPSAKERGVTFMGIDANPSSLILAEKAGLRKLSVGPRLHTKYVNHSADYSKIYGQVNLNFCIV